MQRLDLVLEPEVERGAGAPRAFGIGAIGPDSRLEADTQSEGGGRLSDTPPRPFAAPKDLHHRPLTTGARVCGVCRVGPAVEGAARARPGASGAYSGCAAAGATPRSIFFDHQARRTNGRQPRRGRICVQTPFAARARPTQRWRQCSTSSAAGRASSRRRPPSPSLWLRRVDGDWV